MRIFCQFISLSIEGLTGINWMTDGLVNQPTLRRQRGSLVLSKIKKDAVIIKLYQYQ